MHCKIAEDHASNFYLRSNTTVEKQLSEDTPYRAQSPSPPSTPPYSPTRDVARMYVNLGILCAIISLFILPEVFGAAAIILGAYTWRREKGNRGIIVVILGIICMLVGLYFTAYFILGDLFPS
jgi:hypothetical protein